MNKDELLLVTDLYWEARDAYVPQSGDHKHLKEALLGVLDLIYREGAMDANTRDKEYKSLNEYYD
jgi:hypothetical protein